jgi:hypothetical protein
MEFAMQDMKLTVCFRNQNRSPELAAVSVSFEFQVR